MNRPKCIKCPAISVSIVEASKSMKKAMLAVSDTVKAKIKTCLELDTHIHTHTKNSQLILGYSGYKCLASALMGALGLHFD